MVESACSVQWGQLPGAAAVQGGKLHTQEKQQFFWLSRFFMVIFWNKSLQMEWFTWYGDLAEYAGRTGPGGRFLTRVFLQDWGPRGFSVFSPFLVSCPFDFGDRNRHAGLGEGPSLRVESRSDVLPLCDPLLLYCFPPGICVDLKKCLHRLMGDAFAYLVLIGERGPGTSHLH